MIREHKRLTKRVSVQVSDVPLSVFVESPQHAIGQVDPFTCWDMLVMTGASKGAARGSPEVALISIHWSTLLDSPIQQRSNIHQQLNAFLFVSTVHVLEIERTAATYL